MGVKAKEFAALLGVTPSYVTKLGQQGRLVREADGSIDAEASRMLIEQTGGDRPDVAERHRAQRTRKDGAAPVSGGMSLSVARAMKEEYAALRAREEYQALIRNLIAKDDVETAMRFIGGAVRAAFDVFPDQTAALVAPVSNLDEIHEVLTQACRDALHNIETAIKQQQDALGKERAA